MSYKLTCEPRSKYLHIAVHGTNSIENVLGYLSEVREKCLEQNCFNVLVEENLQGPGLKTFDIFKVVKEASKNVYPRVLRIAYVDVNQEHVRADLKFAEDVAVNRGVNVKLFPTVAEAEKWLC